MSVDQHTLYVRCRSVVVDLNLTNDWSLTDETRDHYAVTITALANPSVSESQLRTMITNYHFYHAEVAILRQDAIAGSAQSWVGWMEQAAAILRHAGLDWCSDPVINFEDIVQEAVVELYASLDSYRYQSKFSTWVHSVIVRRVYRLIRYHSAAKRKYNRQDTVDVDDEGGPAVPDFEQSAQGIESKAFMNLVYKTLDEFRDDRIKTMIHMWIDQDHLLRTIGIRYGISQSRVSVLLNNAVLFLRQHPDIMNWIEPV